MTLELTLAGIALAVTLGADPGSGAGDAHQTRVEERVVIMNDGGPGHEMHGPITRQQWVEKHTAMFDQLDKNHDGKLSPEEMMEGHHMMMRMHGHGGPDGDPMHMVMRHDGPPGDNEEIELRHDGSGERHVMIFRHEGGPGELDANKDGKLSFEEFASPLRKAFDEMDANHDGFIDKAEQDAAHHSHGDMPPPPPPHP